MDAENMTHNGCDRKPDADYPFVRFSYRGLQLIVGELFTAGLHPKGCGPCAIVIDRDNRIYLDTAPTFGAAMDRAREIVEQFKRGEFR